MNRFSLVLISLLLICSLSHVAHAQLTITEHKDTSRSGTVYTFPVFNSTNPNNPHEKINRWLQDHELSLQVGEEDSSIFEKIWPTYDAPYSGTTEYSYRVITNTRKILSIEILQEGCGAYCEGFSTYYNFDANTGNIIELQQLFTETGHKQLAKGITDERVLEVKAEIKKATAENDPDTKSMYEECLEYVKDPSGFNGGFYIEKTKVHVLRERCSNHAMRALDEIDEFDNIRSFAQLHPYLSDYGKKLLY